MPTQPVIFLHGFASSGQGSKAEYLQRRYAELPGAVFYAFDFNPTPIDFQQMTITGMIHRLRQFVLDRNLRDVRLIGSSMGCLVALNYAHRFGGVARMLLLAPALNYHVMIDQESEELWRQIGTTPVFHFAFQRKLALGFDFHLDGQRYREPVAPAAPVLIIHGKMDEVLPLAASRVYAAEHEQVELLQVDSDHRLNDQLPFIWEQVQSFLQVNEGE